MAENELMTRGYSIPLAARFILEDPDISSNVPETDLEDVRAIAVATPNIWVPRRDAIRLWEIIDRASPDEQAAYNNLIRCGQSIANEAISTFLKLLLRVLSPKQFAKKFKDIWAHEHKGGRVETLVEDNAMTIHIVEVAGFDHVGPIGAGFVKTALTALGLKDLTVRDHTWSRAVPGPEAVRLEMTWR